MFALLYILIELQCHKITVYNLKRRTIIRNHNYVDTEMNLFNCPVFRFISVIYSPSVSRASFVSFCFIFYSRYKVYEP